MIPANFKGSNCVMDTSDVDQFEPLSVFRGRNVLGYPVVISCWKVTAEELAEIQRTGRVWLHVIGGTMPPVAIVAANPFVPPAEQSKTPDPQPGT